jgi:hypothetical protein
MEENNPVSPAPRTCKNCGAKLSKRGKFCPGCGQPEFTGVVTMRSLFSKFLSNITHLDNKFVKMSGHLLVPGKVTTHYFQGKIKRYPHPVQFFFIVMFFFLLMFSKQFDAVSVNMFSGNLNISSDEEIATHNGVTVSKSNLFDALQRCMVAREYQTAYNTLPETWRTPETRLAFDSVQQKASGAWEKATADMLFMLNDSSSTGASTLDSIAFNFGFSDVRISTYDFVNLSPDSIIQRYQFNDWSQQVILRQGIKAVRDQHGLINRYVGSFGWAILVLIAFMALLFKLLYWKRGSNYVEHFIFFMHQQSGLFLLITLFLVVHEYLMSLGLAWLLLICWIPVSLLFAMKRYYNQGWGVTLFKWLIASGMYLCGLVVLFVATLLVVFVIF